MSSYNALAFSRPSASKSSTALAMPPWARKQKHHDLFAVILARSMHLYRSFAVPPTSSNTPCQRGFSCWPSPAEAPWLDLILGLLEELRFPQPQSPSSPMYNSKTLAQSRGRQWLTVVHLLQLKRQPRSKSIHLLTKEKFKMTAACAQIRRKRARTVCENTSSIETRTDNNILEHSHGFITTAETNQLSHHQHLARTALPPTTCFALASFAPRTGPPLCMGTNQLLHRQQQRHRTAFTHIYTNRQFCAGQPFPTSLFPVRHLRMLFASVFRLPPLLAPQANDLNLSEMFER